MSESLQVVVLPGDGIGPEVIQATMPVLEAVLHDCGKTLHTTTLLAGGCSYDAHGTPLTDETLRAAQNADAVLLGAVGGPKWEPLSYELRPERALLALRKELGLFANLRPAVCFPALADASPLKRELIEGLDILVVRELTGGIYFGDPRGVSGEGDARVGINTLVYSVPEIRRIARVAFDIAMKRDCKVVSVDKANVLEVTELWRDVVTEEAKNFPEVTLSHMYVDNAAMQLVRDPGQFDVIVTGNLFGDILSDVASQLTGSIGMLASASMGADHGGMYEPVHGSAPDIAGQGKANPLATILSGAMMLRLAFNETEGAGRIEHAVATVLAEGKRTVDLAAGGPSLSTTEMSAAVVQAL